MKNMIYEASNTCGLPWVEIDWAIVVVAFGQDVEELARGLQQLEKKSLSNAIQIVASDTPELRVQCEPWKNSVRHVLPVDYPVDHYWQTVLQAIAYQGKRTVFVRVGSKIPTHWDARLIAALEQTTALALSPISAQHQLLTVFNQPRQPKLTVDEVDQWLVDYIEGQSFDLAMILESAAALQGEQWPSILENTIGGTDNDLFLSIREQGEILLGTDQVYIDDSAVAQLNHGDKLPDPWKKSLQELPPMIAVRHALSELDERAEKPPKVATCLPVQLHIAHGWGGGLCRWVEDAIAGDVHHQNLVLRPLGDWSAFGKTLALYRSAAMDVPIKSWLLAQPILSTAISHYQYQQILDEIIRDFKVERLMVSSLIAQSLDILRTSLPTTFVCHDFYPFCPAVVATFDTPCTECNSVKQQDCQTNNDHHRFFVQESAGHWETIRTEFIQLVEQDNVCLVAPTESVVSRYRELVPTWAHKKFNVIPHGLGDDLLTALVTAQTRASRRENERLRVVVLGSVVAQKGGDVLTAIIKEMSQFADVWLLGSGKEGKAFKHIPGVTVLPRYERMALAEELKTVHANIGLLLSTVPETFSYTLSELWAAGIPVLASKLGAFSDRVREGENGWLVAPEPKAVMAKLQWLRANRAHMSEVQKNVCEQAQRTNQEMMADYHQIEPAAAGIARRRFFRARRQYNNPYQQGEIKKESPALHIDQQAPFRSVLAEFMRYAGHKIGHSPKAPRWLRYPIVRLLTWRGKR